MRLMRLSKFYKSLMWLIIFTASFIVAMLTLKMEPGLFYMTSPPLIPVAKFFTGAFLAIQIGQISHDLRDFVALKYKMVVKPYSVECKYLTVFWFFIPYWKPLDTKYRIYETQNVFGAKSTEGYSSDVTYRTKEEAGIAVAKHKKKREKAKIEYFRKATKKDKETIYV